MADEQAEQTVAELFAQTERQWQQREATLQAVRTGDAELVERWLADDSTSEDYRNDLRTVALCKAAELGEVDLCRALVQNLRELPEDYVSPLVVALDRGQLDVAGYFAEVGIGIDKKELGKPYPAHLAAALGPTDILSSILQHESEVDRRATVEGVSGVTPLMAAAAGGQVKTTRMLLEHGADPELVDDEDRCALDHARDAHQEDVVDLLSRFGGDRSASPGWFQAIERGLVERVEELLGAEDIDARDERKRYRGMTGLILAVYRGHHEIARILLEHGAEVGAVDSEHDRPSPRWPAIAFDDTPEDMRRLGCEPRRTALHYAAESGSREFVTILISHGAPNERQDDHGMTPLHLAALRGRSEAAEALLASGADPLACTLPHPIDEEPKTPEQLASEAGHGSLAVLLRSYADGSRKPAEATFEARLPTSGSETQTATPHSPIPTREEITALGVAAEYVDPDLLLAEIESLLRDTDLELTGIEPRRLTFQVPSGSTHLGRFVESVERLGAEGADLPGERLRQQLLGADLWHLGWD